MLLSVDEARNLLLENLKPTNSIKLPIEEALGMTLAEDIYAPFGYPHFDNSSMDGFAVRSEDVESANINHPVFLELVEDIPAGIVPQKQLSVGEASRIMTGGVLPKGADCVVPVEYTNYPDRDIPISENIRTVKVIRPVSKGDYIRKAGEDFIAGTRMLPSRRLRAQDIGLLAMLGIRHVNVHRKPKIALLSSGNELVRAGTPLKPGQLYESNSFMLTALIAKYGGETLWLGVARDRLEDISEVLNIAVQQKVDLIVSTAGVSVGAYDYVKDAVEQNGEIKFWRVNMRPGKPLAFGKFAHVPFIGLPGNPVSAFVGFEVFGRPALQKLAGLESEKRVLLQVVMDETISSDGRESYLRAVVWQDENHLKAKLAEHQGSGNLFSVVSANALLIVPSGVKSVPAGGRVDAWLID
jgi:molybdopterin molybdotransferase